MKIAVFGASGMIGQRITLEALVRGHEVKVITRHPAQFPIAHPRLSVVQGDILAAGTIAETVTGSDVVINATGPAHDENSDAVAFYRDSTQAVIEGVKRAGVKRLLVVGGAGSLEVAPGVQLVDTPEFPAAWKVGAGALRDALPVYRASDINWTFFSPAAFIAPGKRSAHYRTGTDQLQANDQGESYISVEDYAVAMIDEIETPQFERQRFTAVSLTK